MKLKSRNTTVGKFEAFETLTLGTNLDSLDTETHFCEGFQQLRSFEEAFLCVFRASLIFMSSQLSIFKFRWNRFNTQVLKIHNKADVKVMPSTSSACDRRRALWNLSSQEEGFSRSLPIELWASL